jgi:hypothetical protein
MQSPILKTNRVLLPFKIFLQSTSVEYHNFMSNFTQHYNEPPLMFTYPPASRSCSPSHDRSRQPARTSQDVPWQGELGRTPTRSRASTKYNAAIITVSTPLYCLHCDKTFIYAGYPRDGTYWDINPLNAEWNPIRHLLAFVRARHFVQVSRIRVKRKREQYKTSKLLHCVCPWFDSYLHL